MSTTEQANQLRLAAELIETGHPFEVKLKGSWERMTYASPIVAIANGNQLRPILATPPDNRPLIFTHEGKEWTYHRPGDPMPCDGDGLVEVLYADGQDCDGVLMANSLDWGLFFKPECRVIGWRYAETTKTVELGPEDVIAKLKEAIAMLETLANVKA